MIGLRFERLADGDTSSFDLGDITVRGDGGVVSSAGKSPSQSMMIYVAITDLIEGVCRLCSGQRRVFEFIGADSSFRLLFSMKKNRMIEIVAGAGWHTSVGCDELLRSIDDAVTLFLADRANQLPDGSPALEDLEMARRLLGKSISSLGSGATVSRKH